MTRINLVHRGIRRHAPGSLRCDGMGRYLVESGQTPQNGISDASFFRFGLETMLRVHFQLLALGLAVACLSACSEEQQHNLSAAGEPLISHEERVVVDAALSHARTHGRTALIFSLPDICLDQRMEPRTTAGHLGMMLELEPPPGYEALDRDPAEESKLIPDSSIGGVRLCNSAAATGQIRMPYIVGNRAHVQVEWYAERSNHWLKRELGRWTVSEVTWKGDDI